MVPRTKQGKPSEGSWVNQQPWESNSAKFEINEEGCNVLACDDQSLPALLAVAGA